MIQEFYSNGKLLISGEYAILDGAIGLAIPTSYGQSLRVTKHKHQYIAWKSIAVDGSVWFETNLNPYSLEIQESSNLEIARTLQKILRQATKLNSKFLYGKQGYSIASFLDFNRNWGLGSSSTLINNIANWAEVNAHELLSRTFSGSGYDIACAQRNTPIIYQIKDGVPIVKEVDLNLTFSDQLYFVYLNQKKNSRDAIAAYRERAIDKDDLIEKISQITHQMVKCKDLSDFEQLIHLHENILSKTLGIPTIASENFSDYKGAVKSLGGWGGDFILATGNENTTDYFKNKGYEIVIPFNDMIL